MKSPEAERLQSELEALRIQLAEKDVLLASLREQLARLEKHDKIRRREAELELAASEIERAQEMATMGSWVLEVATGQVKWTPELHRMFGQESDAPVPSLVEQESWFTPKSWQTMLDAVNRTIRDGAPYNIELEAIRRDGSITFLRSIGEAERDENGQIVRLRGVAQDISELKLAEQKLRRALEQEKAARIYKDQFLANMSHEIRTPLNGVVGFASLLRDDQLDAAERNEYIDVIEACSDQLLNLINDIIDLARIEAGEVKTEEQVFNLAQLIDETVAMVNTARSAKDRVNLDIVTRIPKDLCSLTLRSDRLRLQQILTNLLSNALKFSDQGEVEIGIRKNETGLQCYVKDQGIGIETERLELIFERFEHLDGTARKYEGAGLGLSISNGLASLLGARLQVESNLGEGSTFYLCLPSSLATKTPPASGERSRPEISATCQGVVLVAEDEAMNQKFIELTLRKTNCRFLFAKNGTEAVRLYREQPRIDLVLMDIRMPLMNGDQAAAEILRINPKAKIIAQTAYTMQEEMDALMRRGFVDRITKPFKQEDLLAVLNKWLPA